MGIVHLSLQGKGSVGKSLVAIIVAQYYAHLGAEMQCIDTDRVNSDAISISSIKGTASETS